MLIFDENYKARTYPLIDINFYSRDEYIPNGPTQKRLELRVQTYVRKKNTKDGKYYLIPVKLSVAQVLPILSTVYLQREQMYVARIQMTEELYQKLIAEVYNIIMFYKIDPNLVIPGIWGDPRPVIYLDPDQNTERTRLSIE